MRYWEDFQPGQVFDLGHRTVTRDEIIDFGRCWIPQLFHVDELAARHSAFGGLVASGWHTACIFMRPVLRNMLAEAASMGSPGVRDLRWTEPVRPGDVLHAFATMLRPAQSATQPRRGTVEMLWECAKPDSTVVLRMTEIAYFARRDQRKDA